MLSPEICDRARLARDQRFDGRFFIGVRTTGIYCRPICPVHPARSENVRFFSTAEAARLAARIRRLACAAADGTLTLEGVAFPQLVASLVRDGGLDHAAAEWVGMRTLGEPDADVAGRLGLPTRMLDWWRRRRTQDALRPWRSYAALLLAGVRAPRVSDTGCAGPARRSSGRPRC